MTAGPWPFSENKKHLPHSISRNRGPYPLPAGRIARHTVNPDQEHPGFSIAMRLLDDSTVSPLSTGWTGLTVCGLSHSNDRWSKPYGTSLVSLSVLYPLNKVSSLLQASRSQTAWPFVKNPQYSNSVNRGPQNPLADTLHSPHHPESCVSYSDHCKLISSSNTQHTDTIPHVPSLGREKQLSVTNKKGYS